MKVRYTDSNLDIRRILYQGGSSSLIKIWNIMKTNMPLKAAPKTNEQPSKTFLSSTFSKLNRYNLDPLKYKKAEVTNNNYICTTSSLKFIWMLITTKSGRVANWTMKKTTVLKRGLALAIRMLARLCCARIWNQFKVPTRIGFRSRICIWWRRRETLGAVKKTEA